MNKKKSPLKENSKNDTKILKYRLKIAKKGGNINIKKMINKIIMAKK